MSNTPQKIAVPAARSSAAVLAVRRRVVLGVLIVAAVAGVLSAFAWLTREEPQIAVPPNTASTTVAYATQAATDYLNAAPTAVPVAQGVSPELGRDSRSQKLAWSSLNLSGVTNLSFGEANKAIPVQLIRFTTQITTDVASGQSTLYNLYVPMASSSDGKPYVAALPSLLPVTSAPTETLPEADLTSYANSVPGDQVPDPARRSIALWAAAFASEGNQSKELERLTGDQDPAITYNGLGGWSLVGEPVFNSAAVAPNGNGIVVQTTLVLQPPATTGTPVRVTYDVWVATGGGQDNPLIVAWGPAGSYPVMTPDMNQVPATS